MKFDCIIMNPPYDGKAKLYSKITDITVKLGHEVVCLSPYIEYILPEADKSTEALKKRIEPYFESFEKINGIEFDAAFDKELAIMKFSKDCKQNISFGNSFLDNPLFWERDFKNKILAKQCYKKIFDFCNNIDNCKKHLIVKKDFDKFKYKVGFGKIRGHRINGKLCWDWTTIFDNVKRKNFLLTSTGDSVAVNAFPFNTSNECENFVKYTDLDIFMFSVFTLKTGFNNNKYLFKYFPYMSTYKKEWTSDEVAKEIGFIQEEVDYMHEEMKTFGWKTKNNRGRNNSCII